MGRTGAFISIHAQLERVKSEGVVDFFQFIKSSRMKRPGMVQTVVSPIRCDYIPIGHHCLPPFTPQGQYVFCHAVISEYIDSFETYSNFKDVV